MSTDSKEIKDIQPIKATEEAIKVNETNVVDKKIEPSEAKDTSKVNENTKIEQNQDPIKKPQGNKEEEQQHTNEVISDNLKGVELKAQKSSQDNTNNDSRSRGNSQLQQNLNSAFSAMGGFMSGIINKVQQGAQIATAATSTNPQMHRHKSEDAIQEREVLLQSAQNRKSSVYALLKDWDTARINSLNIHRNIIESILGRVDQRMKASQDNITGLSTIMRVIVEQIKNSVSVHLPNVSNTHIYKSVYGKLYEGVHKFENHVQEKKEKALAFAEKVDIDIHQSLVLTEAESYTTTITTIRQNLLNLKRSLHEQQLKVSRKSSKVKEVYTNNIDTSKKAKKDFQKSLYSFLHACQDFRDLQIVLAKATVGFWKKAVELEKHRSKAIQHIIQTFNLLHNDYVIRQGIPSYYTEDIQQILSSQAVTDEFIAQHMDFNSIISPEDQIYISTQLKKPKKIITQTQLSVEGKQEQFEYGIYDISIQEVYHFLTKIVYVSFDDSGLAHKKIHAQREHTKDHFKNTTIVVTPDSFLLCYDDIIPHHTQQQQQQQESQEENKNLEEQVDNKKHKDSKELEDDQKPFYSRKPDYKMQIQQITFKKNGLVLDLKSQSKSTFMSLLLPSSEIKFQFKSSDQMEEFISIIQVLEEQSD